MTPSFGTKPSLAPILGVDVGGTFTDFVYIEGGLPRVDKRPSTPDDPARAVLDGLAVLDAGARSRVAHGTTVATNALLERRGARTVFVTTRGFGDLLRLGRGERRQLYALAPEAPPCLVADEDVIEVDERLGPGGEVLRALSADEVARVAQAVAGRAAPSVAVCLLFSFADARHERALGEALSELDDTPFVTLSADVLPEMREYERASTTVVNAYLGPVMAGYLARLGESAAPRPLWVMASHGGVLPPASAARLPVATLLSGPAAGVAGAVAVARRAGFERVLSFDMGGTSTDVALCEGEPPLTDAAEIDGLPIQHPMVDVHTIGAGGGSVVRVDAAGSLRVGPRSAGADPGPACYGRGGDLPTVTDAQVVLGRLPATLPLAGELRLDLGRATAVLEPLAERLQRSVPAVALAVLAVAEAHMERALRRVSVERGRDPAEAVLLPFGGAGGLHACALAESLGMDRVLVPRRPGTLSAAGLLLSPRAATASRTVLGGGADAGRAQVWQALARRARAELVDSAADLEQTQEALLRRSADLRYKGQSSTLPVEWPEDDGDMPSADVVAAATESFERAHERHFGYRLDDTPVEIVTLRLRATMQPLLSALPPPPRKDMKRTGETSDAPVVLGDGRRVHVSVRHAANLREPLDGPAVLLHGDATTWVAPRWRALGLPTGDVLLQRHTENSADVTREPLRV